MSQYFRLPVASVSATNPSVGTNGSSAPTSSTEIGGIDSGTGNLVPVAVSSAGEIKVSAASLPLPAGAATAARQDTGNTSLAGIDSSANAIEASAAAIDTSTAAINTKTPALVSGRVPVDGSGVTQPVSGTVTANAGSGTFAVSGTVTANAGSGTFAVSASSLPLPTGAATETTLAAASAKLPATLGQKAMAAALAVSIASDQSSLPVTLGTGANTIGALTANQSVNVAQMGGVATSLNQGVVGTGVQRVVEAVTATSAVTSVASSATSVSLLASNTARSGAMFYNDSTQICYLKLGATASTSSYTVQLAAGSYYELPPARIYTGAIDGIWASANGNMRITELS